MRGALVAVIVLIVVVVGVVMWGVRVQNDLVRLEQDVNEKWAQVQNPYQRRADLIPNLVETVKGYAAQEREVLTQVTEARAKASQIKVDASTITDPAKFKEFQDAQNALTGALGRLLVTVERYPDLKSNQNFLALQSQLEGTENRIAVARRDYIEAVRAYNTELKTFPGVLWASTPPPRQRSSASSPTSRARPPVSSWWLRSSRCKAPRSRTTAISWDASGASGRRTRTRAPSSSWRRTSARCASRSATASKAR